MQLVLELEAGAAEWDMHKDLEIKLLDEDAHQILAVNGRIKVPRGEPGRRARVNSIMTFGNVKFHTAGDYVFAILVGGETKKEVVLRVNHVPPPETA